MPITSFLEENARKWPNDVALVEMNPEVTEFRPSAWREYELMEPSKEGAYRREITWSIFDEKANRVANTLLKRGIKKGDKVGILLMNCRDFLSAMFVTVQVLTMYASAASSSDTISAPRETKASFMASVSY